MGNLLITAVGEAKGVEHCVSSLLEVVTAGTVIGVAGLLVFVEETLHLGRGSVVQGAFGLAKNFG